MYLVTVLLLARLCTISGYVADTSTHKPLEYAVVILYDTLNRQVKGTYTDEDGMFVFKNIQPGGYYITADFLGYKRKKTSKFAVKKKEIFLDTIYLSPTYIKMEDIKVGATPEKVERKIDRLVVRPTGDVISRGGTASDVLRGVPGVKVDAGGNVEIKGSKNYTVMINGKPAMMNPDEILRSIPAAEIDHIDIITNPSAEYDPESNAIVNIILKGSKINYGRNINLRVGTYKNYGASLLWGMEKSKWSFYVNPAYYNYGQQLGYHVETLVDTDTILVDDSKVFNYDNPAAFRTGMLHEIDGNTSLGMEASIGKYVFYTKSDMFYRRDSINLCTVLDEKWSSQPMNVALSFSKKFTNKNILDILLYGGKLSSSKLLDKPQIKGIDTIGGTKTEGNGKRKTMRFDMKYKWEFKNIGCKAGYRYDMKDAYSTTTFTIYNDTTYTNKLFHRRTIHAGFFKIKGTFRKFSYSGGIRVEFMNRKVDTVNFQTRNIFPSAYISYNIGRFSKVNISYSRRIERPSAYSLNPVRVWVLPNEVHLGNPRLTPQYNHSFELNFDGPFIRKNLSLSLNLSYIYRQNFITTVYETDSGGNVIEKEVNFPFKKDVGGSFTIEWSPFRFLNVRISPELWSYQFNKSMGMVEKDIRYDIPVNLQIVTPIGMFQLFGTYSSAYKDGETKYFRNLITQMAFATRIRNFTVVLTLLDALHTYEMHSFTEFSCNGYRDISFRPAYPTLFLSIQYSVNKINRAKTIEEDYKSDIKGM